MTDRAWQREFVKRAMFGESMYLTYYVQNHVDDNGVLISKKPVDIKPEFGVLSYPDEEGDDSHKLCSSTLAFQPPPGTSAGSHGYDQPAWVAMAEAHTREQTANNQQSENKRAKTASDASANVEEDASLERELERAPTVNECCN